VTDENQQPRYFVKGQLFSFGHKIHIYDKDNNEVAFVREKVLAFLKKFEITVNGEVKGMVRQKFSWFHPKFEVDFMGCQITGDIFEWNYQITRDGKLVATIERKVFSWANTFYLDILSPEDEVTVLALALAIDAAHRDSDNAAAISISSGYGN
jgi:uncharacterized protein YxjI